MSTLLVQQFQGSPPETHLGAAYWAISTNTFDTKGVYTLAAQGYVSAAHEDLEFPTIAATDGPETLMSFTLNGNGGPSGADNGGFYPSSAYGILTTQSGGLLSSTIHISALGRSPYDGSTEYLSLVPYPPRWGDYGWAIYVPSTPGSSNGNIYFASEYIQHPNCNDAKFLKDPTCGGTRGLLANWGSSVSSFAT